MTSRRDELEAAAREPELIARLNPAITGIKNPSGGADIPLPASQSLLSVTTVKLAADAVVATAGTIPFDTVVRDDLGLFISSTLGIKVPATATQIRIAWNIAFTSGSDGTYRKVTPYITIGNVNATLSNSGLSAQIRPSTNVAQKLTHEFCSHLIDVAAMLAAQTPNPLVFAGDTTDHFLCKLGHDATVGSLSVLAGSSMTIEVYAPA